MNNHYLRCTIFTSGINLLCHRKRTLILVESRDSLFAVMSIYKLLRWCSNYCSVQPLGYQAFFVTLATKGWVVTTHPLIL